MDSKIILTFAVVAVTAVMAYPYPDGPPLHANSLPLPRQGHGGYDNDKYFQYINVPEHKVFEWGYRRGNPHHFREEYLSQKDHTFKAKVKWADTHDGYGEHYYDINHGPSYEKHHEPVYHAPEPVYKPGPHH